MGGSLTTAGIYVAPLGQIIPTPSQPDFTLNPNVECLVRKQQI